MTRKGKTEPRIWTPPLRELTPETTLGYDVIDFAKNVLRLPPLPWQEWLLVHALEIVGEFGGDWHLRFRVALILVARQNGKALALDTEIPTPDGWKHMADIHVGDYVFGQDGKPAKVLIESPIFHKPMYRVTFDDGSTIDASGDHIWTVKTKCSERTAKRVSKTGRKRAQRHSIREGGWFDITTAEMADDFARTRPDGRIEYKYRVPMNKAVEYPERDLPIDPYLLGAWLGDGASHGGSITIAESDVVEFVPLLEECGYGLTRTKTINRAPRFVIDKKPIGHNRAGRDSFYTRLKSLGVINNKHIPEQYMTASVEQRWALLQGLMDTDGCCSKVGQCEFVQKRRELCEQVLELCASLGIKARMHPKKAACNGKPAGTVYRITFFTDSAHPCFRMERKRARLKDSIANRTAYKAIASIERIEDAPSKCIAIDNESHLYLAGRQYTPTHNTYLSMILALFFLYVLGVALILGTAQDLAQAEETWEAAVNEAEGNDELAEEIEKVFRGKGSKELRLQGYRRYKVATPNEKNTRGKSCELVMLDELRTHKTFDAWSAASKTIKARRSAIVWCISNAGDGSSVVLRHLRIQAHRAIGDPDGIVNVADGSEPMQMRDEEREALGSIGIFEWSATPGCDKWDRDEWAQANPSMGYGFLDESAIASDCASDPENDFRVEDLCQWVTQAAKPPFPEGAWEAGTDERSTIAPDSPLSFGVDVSADRKHAAIAVCGERADHRMHVELVAYERNIGWLADWFTSRVNRYGGHMAVAVQGGNTPVASIAELLDAIDGVSVTVARGPKASEWCGRMWDSVAALDPDAKDDDRDGMSVPVMHVPQPRLDLAANIAVTRPSRNGTWTWDRDKSPDDISPIVAATMALGLATEPREEQQVSAYAEADLLIL